jgi:hypothetical protein
VRARAALAAIFTTTLIGLSGGSGEQIESYVGGLNDLVSIKLSIGAWRPWGDGAALAIAAAGRCGGRLVNPTNAVYEPSLMVLLFKRKDVIDASIDIEAADCSSFDRLELIGDNSWHYAEKVSPTLTINDSIVWEQDISVRPAIDGLRPNFLAFITLFSDEIIVPFRHNEGPREDSHIKRWGFANVRKFSMERNSSSSMRHIERDSLIGSGFYFDPRPLFGFHRIELALHHCNLFNSSLGLIQSSLGQVFIGFDDLIGLCTSTAHFGQLVAENQILKDRSTECENGRHGDYDSSRSRPAGVPYHRLFGGIFIIVIGSAFIGLALELLYESDARRWYIALSIIVWAFGAAIMLHGLFFAANRTLNIF